MLRQTRLLAIGAVVALAATVACAASRPSRQTPQPIVETRLFSFHSNFWVNLHHFLYVTARARAGLDSTRPAVTSSLGDTIGFGALSPALRGAWNDALAYYARSVARKDILFDSSLVAVNNRLAELEAAPTVRGAPNLDVDIAAALERAAPTYRAVWWPRHDAANRRWTDSAVALVRLHGDAAARAEERAFHASWSSTPVRVDVAAYTNWAGAYTTEHPAHINILSTPQDDNQGPAAFELLFHEVLHTMDDSLFKVLQSSFRARGKRWPRDPTHAFIFYTAGAITRKQFPGYGAFAEQAGLWTRNADFARMLPLLKAHWQPYLNGQGTLEETMRRIADGW